MPFLGPHTVTVPGAVDGWFELLDRYGTRSFGELARAASIRTRATGSRSRPLRRGDVRGRARSLPRSSTEWHDRVRQAWRRRPSCASPRSHVLIEAPRHRRTRPRTTAARSPTRSPPRSRPRAATSSAADLADHAGEWGTPLRAHYQALEVAELPPPTQGVTVLEALRILDGCDARRARGPARAHLVIEAVKLGARDRDDHVTDPGAHAGGRRAAARRRLDRRAPGRDRPAPGRSIPAGPPATRWHRVPVRSRRRRAAREPHPVELPRRSDPGVHVPEWGINLNNRGSSFALDESAVNVFAPSKRPMHTLIPAMVLRDGTPDLVFGSWAATRRRRCTCSCSTHMVGGADPGRRRSTRRVGGRPGALAGAPRVTLRRGRRVRVARARPRHPRRARAGTTAWATRT